MRKIWIMLLGLILLSGCAIGTTDSTASVSSEQTASAAGDWGAAALDAPAQTPKTVASALDSGVESQPDSGMESAAPNVLPTSLRDVLPGEITVWVDGKQLYGILEQGVTLLNTAELKELWPWFQWSGSGKTWTFTGEANYPHEMECVTPENFSGDSSSGIYFQGLKEEYWLPVRWICDEFGTELLWDGEQGSVYLASPIRKSNIPQGQQVPILMYHAVSDDLWGINDLFVSPAEMEKQLEYLVDNGYDPIFFSDLPDLDKYDKPILLTFDDGYDDNYTQLFPLLKEYDVKATVFVITGMLGDEHYLTQEQVKEMSGSGLVDIQSHTVDHFDLNTLTREDQEYQLSQSRLDLARITGKIPHTLCYPSGARDENTLELAEEYYTFGVDMNGGVWIIEEDYYKIDRIYVSREDTITSFAAMIP